MLDARLRKIIKNQQIRKYFCNYDLIVKQKGLKICTQITFTNYYGLILINCISISESIQINQLYNLLFIQFLKCQLLSVVVQVIAVIFIVPIAAIIQTPINVLLLIIIIGVEIHITILLMPIFLAHPVLLHLLVQSIRLIQLLVLSSEPQSSSQYQLHQLYILLEEEIYKLLYNKRKGEIYSKQQQFQLINQHITNQNIISQFIIKEQLILLKQIIKFTNDKPSMNRYRIDEMGNKLLMNNIITSRSNILNLFIKLIKEFYIFSNFSKFYCS